MHKRIHTGGVFTVVYYSRSVEYTLRKSSRGGDLVRVLVEGCMVNFCIMQANSGKFLGSVQLGSKSLTSLKLKLEQLLK